MSKLVYEGARLGLQHESTTHAASVPLTPGLGQGVMPINDVHTGGAVAGWGHDEIVPLADPNAASWSSTRESLRGYRFWATRAMRLSPELIERMRQSFSTGTTVPAERIVAKNQALGMPYVPAARNFRKYHEVPTPQAKTVINEAMALDGPQHDEVMQRLTAQRERGTGKAIDADGIYQLRETMRRHPASRILDFLDRLEAK